MIIQGYLYSILYVFICVLASTLLHRFGVPRVYTRKVLHIMVGFEWFILHHYMGGVNLHFLIVCLLFLILLITEFRYKLLPMMSSDSDNAPGTVYYAVAMSAVAFACIFLPDMSFSFGIGVMCTSLGDGFAGVIGASVKKYNPVIWKNKTLLGSIANLFMSGVSAYLISGIFSIGLELWHITVIAVFSTVLELFVGRGLDNISVTVGVSILSYLLLYVSGIENYLLPIILTPIIVAISLEKKLLSPAAVIAAIVLDLTVSVAFGNFGFLLLLVFLGGASIIEKITKHIVGRKSDCCKKTDGRTVIQVLANGMVAFISSLLFIVTGDKVFIICFSVSIAEGFCDTCASTIGSLSNKSYDIVRMRKCEPGTSGGVSLLGTVAGGVSAIFISIIPVPFNALNFSEAALVAAFAFWGMIFDSFMGAVAQGKYLCDICGIETEEPYHCGKKAGRISGISIINNSTVNFLSTVFSSLTAAAFFLLLW